MGKLHPYFLSAISAFVLITASANAQSASERHKAKGQNQQDQKVFGDEDKMFKATTIPDKWKNESAVILGLKASYVYFTKGSDYCLDETVRERVKLLDKAAVNDYTSFYFTKDISGGLDNVGFRIIKPD